MHHHLLWLCLLSLSVGCWAQPHNNANGIKSTVTQAGVSYLKDIGIEVLEKQLQSLQIPDISGSTGTPIGHISYSLSNIKLGSVNLGTSSATIVPGSGLAVSMSGVSAVCTLNWHYRENSWPHISDSGSADIDVSGASASVSIRGTESGGKPVVQVVKDSVNVGNLDIHLHGGASWLYDLFINLFKGKIEGAIDGALTNAITQNIDQGLNHVLSTLPMDAVIADTTEIYYSLVAQPIFTSSELTLPISGAWSGVPPNTVIQCPPAVCPAPAIPNSVSSQEVNMVISEYVANSAGFVYWKLGKMRLTVTDAQIPKWSPVRLNTTSLRYILPGLYEKFPNQAVVLELFPTESPAASISSSGATVGVTGDLQAFALNSSGSRNLAFTLTGSAKAKGAAALEGETLKPSVAFLSTDFKLSQSNIGQFNPTILDTLINDLLAKGVVPALNALWTKGIPLPTVPGLVFHNPKLIWLNQALGISTDVTYTPPLAV